MSNETFDLGEYLTNKKDFIPEERNIPIKETITRAYTSISEEIDLRDEIDHFIKWVKGLNLNDFEGKRRAIIKRIQDYKRPALIEGTMELFVKFMKESNIKSIRI